MRLKPLYRAAVNFNRAMALRQFANLSQSLDAFESALNITLRPDFKRRLYPTLLMRYAETQCLARRYEDAMRTLERLGNETQRYAPALECLVRANHTNGIALARRLRLRRPFCRAEFNLAKNRTDRAIELVTPFLDDPKRKAKALYLIARAHFAQRRFIQVLDDFEAFLDAAPKFSLLRFRMNALFVLALEERKSYDMAMNAAEGILRDLPRENNEYYTVMMSHGFCAWESRNVDASIRSQTRIIDWFRTYAPQNLELAEALYRRSEVYKNSQQFQEAFKDVEDGINVLNAAQDDSMRAKTLLARFTAEKSALFPAKQPAQGDDRAEEFDWENDTDVVFLAKSFQYLSETL